MTRPSWDQILADLRQTPYEDLLGRVETYLSQAWRAGNATQQYENQPFAPLVLRHEVRVYPGWNRLHETPNYGIHDCELVFLVLGPHGAAEWRVRTHWYLESARQHIRNVRHRSPTEAWEARDRDFLPQPEAVSLGIHSIIPITGTGTDLHDCDYTPGGKCYCGDTISGAREWVAPFLEGGTKWLWPKLEDHYRKYFTPTEGATS